MSHWLAVGVDPGASGAVAWVNHDGIAGGSSLDTTDATALRDALGSMSPWIPSVRVGIEVPVGRPPRMGGWKQISQQWRAIGCAEGVVIALNLPLVRVVPKDWQALVFKNRKKPASYEDRKKLSLRLARERWPEIKLTHEKDSGLAEALWIAWYVAKTEFSGGGKED